MKKISVFLLFAIIITGNVIPQTPLCTPNEKAIVAYYTPSNAHINIVGDDGNKFTMFYSTYWMYSRLVEGKKNFRHNILTYNKKTNTVEHHSVELPIDYRGLFSFGAGDNIFALYYQDTKKEGQKLITAMIPKDGGPVIENKTRLSIKLEKRSYTKEYAAVSPDGTKHAFMFYVVNKNRIASEMRVFVFDENGEEILYKIITPEIFGGSFHIEDVIVNNDGEVALLMLTGEVNKKEVVSNAIQVVLCTDSYTESLGLPFEEGIINSMKICPLKNGNYFIGGYYTSPTSHTTDAFFHCFIDTKTMEMSNVKVRALSDEQVAPQETTNLGVFLAYRTKCCFLQQVDDGSIMMIGHHYGQYHVSSNNGSYDRIHVGNIVYQHFASDGEILAAPMLKNHQTVVGEYDADYELNGLRANFVDKYISFSPFVSKNDVYIMYNETKANFDSGKGAEMYNGLFKAQECCTVMAKLTDAGPEKQLVMLQDSKKRQFCGVNYFDGKNVYFTVSGVGTTMQHFTLP
ncbi:MAG: hypothetical protein IJT51_05025 [Bacteroidales bacterium]|nr:hypothetical protein [Bacteroidales bacterium]